MATRSTIGIIDNRTGVVTSIYCHWNGYPENNGKILVQHWSDPDKIQALMALGDLSKLGEGIDDSTAYGRDRGEEDVGSQTHGSLQDFLDLGEEFNYLWDGVRWNCFEGNSATNLIDLYNIKGKVTA